MKCIARSQVPEYLQRSSFYAALDPLDESTFSVPFACLKPNLNIQSHEDLCHVLHSLRFWGVHSMPMEICRYLMSAPHLHAILINPLLVEFPEFEGYLIKVIELRTIDAVNMIHSAITMGLGVEVVVFLQQWLEFDLRVNDLDAAVRMDDVASMSYIQDNLGNIIVDSISFKAASHGSINILKHAFRCGWAIPSHALNVAAGEGHIDCAKFLHQVCGKACTLETMLSASHSGKLALIQYLHEGGCPWDSEVCAKLASVGALDCLTYARQNGCPWDERTCAAAAGNGHLHCLEFAHVRGCSWDRSTVNNAFWLHHRACLQYAITHGCSTGEGQYSLFVGCAYCVLIAVAVLYNAYSGLVVTLALLLCMRIVEILKYRLACECNCSFHVQSWVKGVCGILAYVIFISTTLIVFQKQIFESVDWYMYGVVAVLLFFVVPLFVIANAAL